MTGGADLSVAEQVLFQAAQRGTLDTNASKHAAAILLAHLRAAKGNATLDGGGAGTARANSWTSDDANAQAAIAAGDWTGGRDAVLEDFAKATAGTDKQKAYTAVNAITGDAAQHAYNNLWDIFFTDPNGNVDDAIADPGIKNGWKVSGLSPIHGVGVTDSEADQA
ncbi:hypothetical protein [endosymbiont GvMRE of Glomus versiforme]|uniref:hypothetical protein n=1 Tax=endosymbiont GvMRE of Glomus versiforme TaxID=2039283 RepID=UPI0011C36244|nr:hypothetical protein [endosymbiont GvMRE of Glomus versiforme]